MAPDGCSGGMDKFAQWVRKGNKLAFTGCCDEHDLFYEQGGNWRDRAFADRILRQCISANLRQRGRPPLVRLHVPWCFWAAVRCFGWLYWERPEPVRRTPPGGQP